MLAHFICIEIKQNLTAINYCFLISCDCDTMNIVDIFFISIATLCPINISELTAYKRNIVN